MKRLFTFAMLAAFVAPMLGCHAEGDVGDDSGSSKTTTVKSSDGSYKKTTETQTPNGSYQHTESRSTNNP